MAIRTIVYENCQLLVNLHMPWFQSFSLHVLYILYCQAISYDIFSTPQILSQKVQKHQSVIHRNK